jgi:hypothetical protein
VFNFSTPLFHAISETRQNLDFNTNSFGTVPRGVERLAHAERSTRTFTGAGCIEKKSFPPDFGKPQFSCHNHQPKMRVLGAFVALASCILAVEAQQSIADLTPCGVGGLSKLQGLANVSSSVVCWLRFPSRDARLRIQHVSVPVKSWLRHQHYAFYKIVPCMILSVGIWIFSSGELLICMKLLRRFRLAFVVCRAKINRMSLLWSPPLSPLSQLCSLYSGL